MSKDLPDFCHIKKAAGLLKLPYWWVQRAVKRGLIPSYTFLNSRRLVRPSEILDFIESTRAGCTTALDGGSDE